MGRVEVYPPAPTYYHRYRVWRALGAEGVQAIVEAIEKRLQKYYQELAEEKTMEKAIYKIAEELRKEFIMNPKIASIDVHIQNGVSDGSKSYYLYIDVAENGGIIGYIRFLIATYYPY